MILLKEMGGLPIMVNCDGYLLDRIDKLRSEGYREVVLTQPPEARTGKMYVDSFDRVGTKYLQRWRELTDVHALQSEIDGLKKEIEATDYKVVKCMEAALMNVDLPYDMEELHRCRQGMRDRINECEEMIKDR